jgi:mannose-6-phosphate isomerase-like protein (cupin superfamily)
MIEKINLRQKLELFTKLWSPKIVGACNQNEIKLVKVQGAFVWHKHELEDELFLVLEGKLNIRLRDQDDLVLEPGEFAVIPKGVEHKPQADEETHIMLVEPVGVVNTGDAEPGKLTQSTIQRI